jgi:predicted ATP-grasp superfamily ATP-dependent carboligase
MNDAATVVVIGNSVRYLAQSAKMAGAEIVSVDAFGDLDTRLASISHERAANASPHALLHAGEAMLRDHPGSWLFGAGFESDAYALASFTRRHRGLLGNDPAVMQLLAEPQCWFSLLRELDIAYPEVAFEAPRALSGWLFKPDGGCGGWLVRRALDADADADHRAGYYQRFVAGSLCSLVFAADGAEIGTVGFNRLFARYPAAGDFRFAGAINGLVASHAAKSQMVAAAQRLTRTLGLRGVNGLDFVMRNGEPQLLELNARPPATLELYETVLPRGGFQCHTDACRGRLPRVRTPESVEGLRVVYARRTLRVPAIDWPAWVTDRPASGECVLAGQPLCTVHANAGDMETVAGRLRQHIDAVDRLLNGLGAEAA